MKLKFLLFAFLLTCINIVQAQTVVDIIVNSPNHNTLEAAVGAAGLTGTLNGDGPFTVFAPTDDAFAALPAGTVDALLADPQGALTKILLYHVVGAEAQSTDLSDEQIIVTLNSGKTIKVTINTDGVFINDARVTVADVVGTNGVVHVIDAVLLPPNTVVDVIIGSSDHNTLEAAVGAAGLINTLNGTGPFTVFAPTDAAFAALPAGTVDALLADPQGALTKILLYHVVGAEAQSTDLSDEQIIVTLNSGKTIKVTISTDGVFINNAQVTVADIVATNGVVHVIDAVLLPPNTVVDVIIGSSNHNTLEAAVGAAGLINTLNGAGPFTVFAPTDAAFAALPAGTVDALLADIPLLTSILTYHVVGANALSTDLSDGQTITTLNGEAVTVTINADGVFINNAKVTVADIVADNGVVHVIDAVLLPPVGTNTVVDIIVNSPDHNTLEAAVLAAGLAGTLSGDGPFTVFAPTDAAFAALPAGTVDALLADIPLLTSILTYHVVGANALSTDLSDGQTITTLNEEAVTVTINADGVFINNAKVTVADIVADNGVVHVIDAVLLPPVGTNTVVDIIVNSPDHNTLEAAVLAAELAGTLSGDGPFTVFAPTDAAFAALPDGTVDALLADIPALTSILTYHVVGANALSTDLSDGQTITTLNGEEVTVTINADGVFINNAKVTVADILADNGVVHVIDAVLLPPVVTNTVVDIIVNSPDHNTLEAAVLAAGLAGTLSGDGPFTVFAPTDAAFAALPAGTVDALLADPQGALTQVLLYHATSETITSEDIISLYDEFPYQLMLNDKTVTFKVTAEGVFINNAKVTVADIIADNGIVHVIDAVLLAPDSTIVDVVRNSPAHNVLESLLDLSEFSSPLEGYGPFTLFAPTDAAISLLPNDLVNQLLDNPFLLEDVLTYHLVGGLALSSDLSDGQSITTLLGKDVKVTINANGVFINNAKVIVADIITDNGVVHVIDAVLLPKTTVVDIINNSEDHFILSNVLSLTGLDQALNGDGPFTVFAPTDEAFDAIPADVLASIVSDPNLLVSILTYHAVGAKALSTDLSDGQEITTLNGAKVKVNINADGVFINDAKVTVADIEADNGVVHVIDAVLLPPPSSSIDYLMDSTLDIYPNPAKDKITIESAIINNEPAQVNITTVNGQNVLSTEVFFGNSIDVSILDAGIYFLKVKTKDNLSIKKLVKQ
jgi:transforming growth factor-beta-induced protein